MKFNEIMKNEETILLRKKDIFNNLKKNEYYNFTIWDQAI
ncbi:hypothetical protein PFNF54_01185 [Plasmodium falciparum NF54]|uniref:Uncharacterized protein n=1 Tax=Plasmodium falciparum (isolate NF54) TaxID=5843 RepID=W7JZJ2_PLAFO|nr:hypothetical protein PFNF54_01185 [Plasmodium falciparum NF54]